MLLTVKKPLALSSLNVFNEIDTIFDNLKSSNMKSSFRILNSEDELKLSLDVPGIKKEDCRIEIKNKLLTFSGKRFDQEYQITESIYLEGNLDTENAEVDLSWGVLNISMKKKKEEVKLLKIKEE